MKRSAKISDIISPFDKATTQAFITNALQVADILEWIFSQFTANPTTHRIKVYQTTFSISEEFMRRMHFIRKKNPLAHFTVIIDRKALQKTFQLWKFISEVYDKVYIADNHSKILLVDFGQNHVAMVTSQNLTRGNRAESTVISSDDKLFFPLLADFNDIRTNNSAPMHEIMNTSPLSHPDSSDNQQKDSSEVSSNPQGDSSDYPDSSDYDNSDYAQSQSQDSSDNSDYHPHPTYPSIEQQIERLASIFVPLSDIATVLDIDPIQLREQVADPTSSLSVAYRRGKAKAKVAIRAQEMELARIGSPLGMQSVRENLLSMEADED